MLFKTRKPASSRHMTDDLDQEFLRFKTITGKDESISFRTAMNGILAFGGSGAGKTSGIGNAVLKEALHSGCGGFFTCAKAGEGERLKKIIIAAGREDDLVYFSSRSNLFFNPLRYEQIRDGEGAGETLPIVASIINSYTVGRSFYGQGSSSNEAFWEEAMKRLLGTCIDLLKLADEEITFFNIRKIIVSAFTEEQVVNYQKLLRERQNSDITIEALAEIENELNNIVEEKFCLQCLLKAFEREKDDEEKYTYGRISSYFYQEFAFLGDKTRSSIEEHVFGLLEPFMSGILRKYFTSKISDELRPELIYKQRKLIVCDFSVKEFGISSVYGTCMLKYAVQTCLERRKPEQDGYTTPVLLYSDEAQYFINPIYDTAFQMTARESRVITCYITQSLHNYVISFGGSHAMSKAKALMACFGLKVFHASTDFETNKMASDIIGHKIGILGSIQDKLFEHSGSLSEQIMLKVHPNEFVTLKTGGPQNDLIVEAIVVKIGPWHNTSENYLKVEFKQK